MVRARSSKFTHVAGDGDEIVNDRGRRNEPVDIASWPQAGNASPLDRDGVRDRQDTIGIIVSKLVQPCGKAARRPPIHAFLHRDTLHDFAQG